MRYRIGASLLLLVSGCASGSAPVDLTKLTPREALYGMEVSYTAAANTANTLAPQISAPVRATLLADYTKAGDALNVADVTVMALPQSGVATPSATSALQAAQVALAALQGALTTIQGAK